jgi:hypothetical protein
MNIDGFSKTMSKKFILLVQVKISTIDFDLINF